MKKMIRKGKVAVLYSTGYGAGWYTWNYDEGTDIVFDRDIVQAVLDKDFEKAKDIASKKYPNAYLGGVYNLKVAWIDKGSEFEIDEYDGAESIHVIGSRKYLKA
jgi:hypothetical protein